MQSVIFLPAILCLFSLAHVCSEKKCTIEEPSSLLQTLHRIKDVRTKDIRSKNTAPMEATNIVYIKVPKTGSSTAAGVTRRIANNHNLSGVFTEKTWIADNGEPGVWAEHGCLSGACLSRAEQSGIPSMKLISKLDMRTFIWTMIRDPVERAMSRYYYMCTESGVEPSAYSKIQFLTQLPPNIMFRYIQPSQSSSLDEVFSTYGLIGVTERYEESLVALAALLQIPLSDVLYVTSKNSSRSYKYDKHGHWIYRHTPLEDEPEEVQLFLRNEFRAANSLDYQLYEMANSTLSTKITAMGLNTKIAAFKNELARAQSICEPDRGWCYGYWRDNGCNYQCLDNNADSLGQWLQTPIF